jgi:predicted HAD superfamily phosphohydrolase YqeG
MSARIIYTLRACWKNKAQLKTYTLDSSRQLPCITDLTVDYLRERGIEALVLDFDGVLASHAEPMPRAEVLAWLAKIQQAYAPHKIYILSNKPTPQRHEYFANNFPGIIFIVAKRKKPYPDGLLEIVHSSRLLPTEVLLADDRLGTGILATIIVGTQACWITKPYTDFATRPIRETFFWFLRTIERLYCKII